MNDHPVMNPAFRPIDPATLRPAQLERTINQQREHIERLQRELEAARYTIRILTAELDTITHDEHHHR